jgi:maltoporin
MKIIVITIFIILLCTQLKAQVINVNDYFSLKTSGRIGVGGSPNGEGNQWKPLNLSGQGSLAGRMEQTDYMDLTPIIHYTPKVNDKDAGHVIFQAKIGMYSQNGQFIGNTNSRSEKGLTIFLPETFVEARHIMGSQWSAWVGMRLCRYDDIHICDYFYFDDHTTTGTGVKYKNTELSFFMPASTDSAGVFPYNYEVTVAGATNPSIRQRMMWVGEHTVKFKNDHKLKLLAEYHYTGATSKDASKKYPSDYGWVVGAKYDMPIKTVKTGSFNQFAIRYGAGIANGGDNGNSYTWATYGPPNANGKYSGAYSISVVEHFMLNLSNKVTLNGYGVFTKSKGGSNSKNTDCFFDGQQMFNHKRDIVVGGRVSFYATDWLHLLGEAHHARRKDGGNPDAAMWKFSFAPTVAALGKRDPWCRPHIRLVFSAARYNDYAMNHNYSPFLQINQKRWGTYLGVKTEWWF